MPPVSSAQWTQQPIEGGSVLRSGHSNGHHLKPSQRPHVWGSKGQLYSGVASSGGGTGTTGGLSFRSGAGLISFRGARHEQLNASALRPHTTGASGSSSFRNPSGVQVTFRSAAASAVKQQTAPKPPAGAGGLAGAPSGTSGSAQFRRVGVASFRSASVPVDLGEQRPGSKELAGAQDASAPQGTRVSAMQQLQQLGLAGMVAYGLLNTLYYTTTFLTVWLMVAKVPQGQGLAAAAKSFLAVFATVWAGSQVTKVARAGGALLLAPLVERKLGWVQNALKLESKNQAFSCILLGCLGMALTVFGVVVVAWA